MTVYLDDLNQRQGDMAIVNMVADTDAELHAMADRIGVARRYHQASHYHVCASKRAEAMLLGARAVSWRECELMLLERCHDRAGPLLTPEAAAAHLAARAAALEAQDLAQ